VTCISTEQYSVRRKTTSATETYANRARGLCHVGIHGNGVVSPESCWGYVTNCGQCYFKIFKSDGHVTSSKQQHGRKGISSVVATSASRVFISFRSLTYKIQYSLRINEIKVYNCKFTTVKNNKKRMGE